MTDYTALANAIKTTLQGDPWIGNTANIKTIETYKRDVSLQSVGGAPFYKEAELPALAVYPNRGKTQSGRTVTLDLNAVQVEITVVSFNTVVLTAAQEHHTAVHKIETLLDAQKTEAQDFGKGVFARDVETTTLRWKKGNKYFFFSRIRFTAELAEPIPAGGLFDDEPGLFDDAAGLFDSK